jgi:hypothetical protein
MAHRHETDRGRGLAHYMLWHEFTYFDFDVIQTLSKGEIKGIYTATFWSSNSGTFSASENGTLYKNGIPFYEDDILVVLNDDTDIAVSNFNATIIRELTSMDTDILFLGWWCSGEGQISDANHQQKGRMCTNGYAVTRRGARKMMMYYEPCGQDIEDQILLMINNKWVSGRRALDFVSDKKGKGAIFKKKTFSPT